MKKYILALALLFICHIGFAQDLNSLFDEFKKEPNADCISISPFMMAIGKMFMGNIVCTGNGDCTLVQLKGKVSKEKIAKLLAKEEMM